MASHVEGWYGVSCGGWVWGLMGRVGVGTLVAGWSGDGGGGCGWLLLGRGSVVVLGAGLFCYHGACHLATKHALTNSSATLSVSSRLFCPPLAPP